MSAADKLPDLAQRIKEIVLAALALPAEQRKAYIVAQCKNDIEMAVEVSELVAAHDKAGSFMSAPTAKRSPSNADDKTQSVGGSIIDADGSDGDKANPGHIVDSNATEPDSTEIGDGLERPGAIIGRYKLLQKIGEGGFGAVFVAEQREPVYRRVALKIIKLGMDTRQVIARFEAERQALALMDHPCIARVLDAGATDTGRPFFVMEYVKGAPITQFCDQNNLTIRERLDLFSQVCLAVQHAHQKGVIHRDIKPGNVLVFEQDGRPQAKVIDFGIAKATDRQLTDKTLFTAHEAFIGTPQYMSPEQAAGSIDIDTRTDVYSLGVLLYELLTGVTPFDAKWLRSRALDEVKRIIREVEPSKPSTRLSENAATLVSVAAQRKCEPKKLGLTIRGDLDWIVMKALDKDRARRYAAASDLAADLQRHTSGEPVIAAPPSLGYRVRKFVRRNRRAVITGAAVWGALVLGIAGTTWGMLRAQKAESKEMAQGAILKHSLEDILNESFDAAEFEPDLPKATHFLVTSPNGKQISWVHERVDGTWQWKVKAWQDDKGRDLFPLDAEAVAAELGHRALQAVKDSKHQKLALEKAGEALREENKRTKLAEARAIFRGWKRIADALDAGASISPTYYSPILKELSGAVSTFEELLGLANSETIDAIVLLVWSSDMSPEHSIEMLGRAAAALDQDSQIATTHSISLWYFLGKALLEKQDYSQAACWFRRIGDEYSGVEDRLSADEKMAWYHLPYVATDCTGRGYIAPGAARARGASLVECQYERAKSATAESVREASVAYWLYYLFDQSRITHNPGLGSYFWEVERRKNIPKLLSLLSDAQATGALASRNIGVGLFRQEDYCSALFALEQAQQIRELLSIPPHPSELAYLAMSQFQTGDPISAHDTLIQLERLLQDQAWLSSEALCTCEAGEVPICSLASRSTGEEEDVARELLAEARVLIRGADEKREMATRARLAEATSQVLLARYYFSSDDSAKYSEIPSLLNAAIATRTELLGSDNVETLRAKWALAGLGRSAEKQEPENMLAVLDLWDLTLSRAKELIFETSDDYIDPVPVAIWSILNSKISHRQFTDDPRALRVYSKLVEIEESRKGSRPQSLALLAMAHFKRGDIANARAALTKLRVASSTTSRTNTEADDSDAKSLAAEAEALIEGTPTTTQPISVLP